MQLSLILIWVKADKYSAKAGLQGYENSPRTPTPTHAREDASNSWVSLQLASRI
ncbi:hypothetical protein SESBI_04486 [Sesbania bispinosa]|nr:hypothetical protein SESBI_04486 [Sesbania bispinosa]